MQVITVITIPNDSREVTKLSRKAVAREVKLIAIGNSQGIRLPKILLRKYGWSGSLVLEEREDRIVLHGKEGDQLSWEDTYRAMARENEVWSDLDSTVADGLD